MMLLLPVVPLLLAGAPGARIDYGDVQICDEAGWCLPLAGWTPRSVLSVDGAVVVADPIGGVVVWRDGAWRGAFRVPPDSVLGDLSRHDDRLDILVCQGRTCRRHAWHDGVDTPADAVERPPPRRTSSAVAFGSPVELRTPAGVETLHEAWSTRWADDRIALFTEEAGCAPCLLGARLLWRDTSGWHSIPPPTWLDWKPWPDRGPRAEVQLARTEEALYARVDGRALRWNGAAWVATDRSGPWASRVPLVVAEKLAAGAMVRVPSRIPEVAGTAGSLFVFLGRNLFAVRAWSSFPDASSQSGDFARVVGVGAGDTLNVRRGPIVVAPVVEQLAPTTSCVAVYPEASRLSGTAWQLVRSPSGHTGWVSARFLSKMSPSEAAACSAPHEGPVRQQVVR